MKRVGAAIALLLCSLLGEAQQVVATNTNTAVPPLVNFSGTLTDANGKPITGTVAVTFSLYSEQSGGAALWMETQNVQPDVHGNYTVMLGSTSSTGLPSDIFVAGEAHWLGVRVEGEAEQPRVLLVSAPYALKAGDAQTLGGLPASAFVLAAPVSAANADTSASASMVVANSSTSAPPANSSDVTTTGGTVDAIPLFSTSTNIQNSLLTQTGTTSINVGGKLISPAGGTATSTAGFNSRSQEFIASAYDSGTSAAVAQTFVWQAQPVDNDTATPSATLNLLYSSGTSNPAQTGLQIASDGKFTFAKGQTFPGTGTITGVTTAEGSGLSGGGTSGALDLSLNTSCAANQILQWNGSAWACSSAGTGTITGVTAGTGLTGGGTSGVITLNVNTSTVPLLNAANTFTGTQTVNGNLSATGVVTGSSFQIGSNLFAFGSYANQNAFLGFGGSAAANQNVLDDTAAGFQALQNDTGGANTAAGAFALSSNTAGYNNVASGNYALEVNTTGYGNTASGYFALGNNNTGYKNTASGYYALIGNATGSQNTASGFNAGVTADSSNLTASNDTFLGAYSGLSTGTLSNATAIGANAYVAASNALVLGSINGVNGATSYAQVGIGTATPQAGLDIYRQNFHTYIGGACGVSGYGGVGFGASSTQGFVNCSNYSLMGDGTNTYINAPTGTISFRINNATPSAMVIDSNGNVVITGNLSKGSGSFKIDHPLDPANKYLYHSFVESPDMMNVYNGVATLDAHGAAWITLPDYFEALNRDFRYQLTAMGRPQPSLYIAREISGNRFRISGGKAGGRVSWQVTGIRHDAYADAHRIQVEEEKPVADRGKYLHPELFGAPPEQAVGYRVYPASSARIAGTRGEGSANNVSETKIAKGEQQ
jgi:trimeric autotransporter adhesin